MDNKVLMSAEEKTTKKTRKPRKSAVNKDGTMSKWWINFFEKLRTYDSIPMNKWNEVQILGYICNKFEQTYGESFSFSMKGAPSKCSELYLIKQMIFMLGSSNPKYIVGFIDWIFENKIITRKTKVISMGYFTTAAFCNEYKLYHKKAAKITRSTQLPKEYIDAASESNIDISTYGDLAFVKMAVEEASDPEDVQIYADFLNLLERMCFDLKVLDNLD